MDLPKAGATYTQERLGIAAVQYYAARRNQIWRETGTGDVGIDGNIEYVNTEGFATGRIVAVQVKSGPSYFKSPTLNGWKFYPERKHRNYWESFPLPVLLILHNPETNISYWADARQLLRSTREDNAFIEVLSSNNLEETDTIALFENAGALDQPFISEIPEILRHLIGTNSNEKSFPLSYFDLFVHGLTNLCRSIYYGMDIIISSVEYNLEATNATHGMGMGHQEHLFAFGFVKFLVAQGLAHIDLSDCLIDWVDREMHPHFVAPLSSRGRALVRLIHQEEARLVADGRMEDEDGLHVAQEAFFEMVAASCFRRFPRIRNFQDVIDN